MNSLFHKWKIGKIRIKDFVSGIKRVENYSVFKLLPRENQHGLQGF